MGGVYAATVCTVKTLRGTDDVLNKMLAGCASGAVLGVQSTRSTRARARVHALVQDALAHVYAKPPRRSRNAARGRAPTGKRPSVGAGACAAFAAMAAAVHLSGGVLAPEDRKSNEYFHQVGGNAHSEAHH